MQECKYKSIIKQPAKRLGSEKDFIEIKQHPFFASIDWVALSKKEIQPPFRPIVTGKEDFSNFDKEFTAEQPEESHSPEDRVLSDQRKEIVYENFTYKKENLTEEKQ